MSVANKKKARRTYPKRRCVPPEASGARECAAEPEWICEGVRALCGREGEMC